MKIKLLFMFVILFILQTNAQTTEYLQQQNARATGYAIVAARNPGKSFTILMIKWDGVHDLEYNVNNQINSAWHPQAVVKGNYFDQTFDGNDFTHYSSVLLSQAEFDTYKSTGTEWWIVCSNLPAFSNSGLIVTDNGNVGIGTYPDSKLTVNGVIKSFVPATLGASLNNFQLLNERGGDVGGNWMYNRLWSLRDGGSNNWYGARLHDGISVDASFAVPHVNTHTWWERDPADNIQSWGNDADTYLTINNGKVGIGTLNPDEMLTVKGKIHAEEIIVTANVTPDYVFQKYYTGKSELKSDYIMPTLNEVAEFTKNNNHLPNVPSAKEMQTSGMNLGEMNNLLLQKVEELTLYLIEQNKDIEQLKAQVTTLMIKK